MQLRHCVNGKYLPGFYIGQEGSSKSLSDREPTLCSVTAAFTAVPREFLPWFFFLWEPRRDSSEDWLVVNQGTVAVYHSYCLKSTARLSLPLPNWCYKNDRICLKHLKCSPERRVSCVLFCSVITILLAIRVITWLISGFNCFQEESCLSPEDVSWAFPKHPSSTFIPSTLETLWLSSNSGTIRKCCYPDKYPVKRGFPLEKTNVLIFTVLIKWVDFWAPDVFSCLGSWGFSGFCGSALPEAAQGLGAGSRGRQSSLEIGPASARLFSNLSPQESSPACGPRLYSRPRALLLIDNISMTFRFAEKLKMLKAR